MQRTWTAAVVGILAGCAPHRAELDAMKIQLGALEQRVATLEAARMAGAVPPPAPVEDPAAAALLASIPDIWLAQGPAVARAEIERLKRDFPTSRAASGAARVEAELAVVGNPVDLTSATWLQGYGQIAPGWTYVVFFESWCPHCRREMPNLVEEGEAWTKEGVTVLTLTQLSRETTAEDVLALTAEMSSTYPVGQITNEVAKTAGVSGIPAAALVYQGRIAWRGHPMKMDPATFAQVRAWGEAGGW